MGRLRVWESETGARYTDSPEPGTDFYLRVEGEDPFDEIGLWLEQHLPHFVVLPDLGATTMNTLIARNVRDILMPGNDPIPIVVPVRGEQSRERREFVDWLVYNEYVPGFPRYLISGKTFISRFRLISEVQGLIEDNRHWTFAALSWPLGDASISQQDVANRVKSIDTNWELFE